MAHTILILAPFIGVLWLGFAQPGLLPESAHICVYEWCRIARPDPPIDPALGLIRRSYDTLEKFPKFLHQAHFQTWLSPVSEVPGLCQA